MNDALLVRRLRELRVPPPASGFEQRLRAALSEEARALAAFQPRVAARTPAARRWTGRAGLTLAVTLGASAAAAAAGWMRWAPREDAGDSSRALPAAGSASRLERAYSQQSSAAPVEQRVAAPDESSATPAPVVRAAPESSPAGQSGWLPELGTQRTQRSTPASSVLTAERPTRAPHEPPPVKRRNAGSPAIVPFELPGVNLSGPGSPPTGGASLERSSERRAPRVETKERERRLPKVNRAPTERAERGKSEAMRERARTREPRGRENAERGLERAREARDRNGK